MARVLAAGLILFGTAAFAGPPAEAPPKPVSVYPTAPTEPPARPIAFVDGPAAPTELAARPVPLLDGTTVPTCPTACDTSCAEPTRPGLVGRRGAEPKTVCCDAPPELQTVLARPVPVTPSVLTVCTESCSTCGEKSSATPLLRGLSLRPARTTRCETEAACPKETSCSGAPCP